jgi:hypothetical protein
MKMTLHLTFCRNNPPTQCDSVLRELARTMERGYGPFISEEVWDENQGRWMMVWYRRTLATDAVIDALRRLAG